MTPVTIGTRGSALALSQTNWVSAEIRRLNPDVQTSIVKIQTTGDRVSEGPFSAIGGKGVFTKELDEALLAKAIDLAVHSMKDLPSALPDGLHLASVAGVEDRRDVLISRRGECLAELPTGSRVGTSSLRRQAQVKNVRPDLQVQVFRGNVDTRLRKLSEGVCDAIIMAAAGIKRLGLEKNITEFLDPHQFVPAVGQGRLAIVCRTGDAATTVICRSLQDDAAANVAHAERVFMAKMEGGCSVPLGCYGEVKGKRITFWSFLSDPDGKQTLRRTVEGPLEDAGMLALRLANELLSAGGREILQYAKSTSR